MIEAASTPYRLSANPPAGPLGLPTGACDLPSLTQLLVTTCTLSLPAAHLMSWKVSFLLLTVMGSRGSAILTVSTMVQRPCQGNNLVVAFAALPCPELPDPHAAQAARDTLQQTRDADKQLPFTQACTLSWTPQMHPGS